MSGKKWLSSSILALTITSSFSVFADGERFIDDLESFKNKPVPCTPKLYADVFGLGDAAANKVYKTSLSEAKRAYLQVKGTDGAVAVNLPAQPLCVKSQGHDGQLFIHMGRSLMFAADGKTSKAGYMSSVCNKVSTVDASTSKMSPDVLVARATAWASQYMQVDGDRIVVINP